MRKHILFAAVILLLMGTGTAATTDNGTAIRLTINEQEQISPTVTNQLTQEDTVTLTFKGRAVTEGLITVNVIETEKISCARFRPRCNITVPAQSSVDFFMELSGASYGQGNLIIEGKSRLTKRTGRDTALINVVPTQGGDTESAPGTTLPYLIGLLAAAALVHGRRSNAL